MSDSDSDKSDVSRRSTRSNDPPRWSEKETILLIEAWNAVNTSGIEESNPSFWSSVRDHLRTDSTNPAPLRSRNKEQLKSKWKDVKAGLKVRNMKLIYLAASLF